jgi:hypothetical protein
MQLATRRYPAYPSYHNPFTVGTPRAQVTWDLIVACENLQARTTWRNAFGITRAVWRALKADVGEDVVFGNANLALENARAASRR